MKANICLPGGSTDFFDIVIGASKIFVKICLDYLVRTSRDLKKEKSLKLKNIIALSARAVEYTDCISAEG